MENSNVSSSASTAYLSHAGDFTIFRFGLRRIRFRTSPFLVRYTKIVKWDHGYIEVMARYSTEEGESEEYIDLNFVLHRLNFNAEKFLAPIRRVEILYG